MNTPLKRPLPTRVAPFVALAAALVACLVSPPRARAYPKPSPAKVSWELDFQHGTPTRITVRTPSDVAPKAYWYMTFSVTNNGNDEQTFLPVFELVDERGNVHRSDQNIPQAVFDAVKAREGKKLMEPIAKVTGRLLVGADQARDSVAIWPEPMERMGTFQIFVGGLSGEAVWYKDGQETPLSKADWTKTKPEDAGTILRKSLEIDYHVPGDEYYPGRDRVIKKDERWVMR
jgi:hypothetical protein